jgi:small subunit ribosomal protein S1
MDVLPELEQGVEGLIHLSELDWTNKNIHPSKVVDLEEKNKGYGFRDRS